MLILAGVSSGLLELHFSASAWCHQMVWEGLMVLFPSFSSRRYHWLFFSFQLQGTDAHSGELCPSCPDVCKRNNHLVRSGFPALPSGSFWNDWNRCLTFFGPCSLAKVSLGYLGLFWDQNVSRRDYRSNTIYHHSFPRLTEPLLICPMP